MRFLALVGILVLAACGADGPPARPNASVGIGDGGVSFGGGFGASNGTVSVGLGL